MLSNVDDWKFNVENIMYNTGIKRTMVRTTLNELIDKVYISRQRVYIEGKFKYYNYTIKEYNK